SVHQKQKIGRIGDSNRPKLSDLLNLKLVPFERIRSPSATWVVAPQMGIDLVTGGAGFIGSHLIDRLLAQGRTVRAFDSFVVGRRANLKHHNGNSSLAIIEGDVADTTTVAAAPAGVERVFHLAARADIVPSIQEPEAYFRS